MTLIALATLVATVTTVPPAPAGILVAFAPIVELLVTLAIVREIVTFIRGRGGPRERE